MQYKLPSESKIGWVYLTVSNLDKSLLFYSKILGFRIIEKSKDFALLGANEQPLLALQEQAGAKPKPPNTRGLYHFAILLPTRKDLALIYKRLEEMWFLQGASDHLVSEALYLIDPDGHGIEIYSDRPRNEWRYKNNQLEMATLPLDIESLLSEISSENIKNFIIPENARIGHIHLHVSDLNKAEEFYTKVLGLDVTLKGYPGAIFMSAGGYHHHVGANIWAGRNAPPTPKECVNLVSFSFKLPSLDSLNSFIKHLEEIKYPFHDNLILKYKGYRGITIQDFDGNNIEIFS